METFYGPGEPNVFLNISFSELDGTFLTWQWKRYFVMHLYIMEISILTLSVNESNLYQFYRLFRCTTFILSFNVVALI